MLKLLRDQFKHLKWILWFVVFLFVFFIFIDWGTGRARSRGLAGLAAQIGNVNISEAQFLKEMRGTEQRYRQLYGEQYEKLRDQIDLASITMQDLVDRQLMMDEAHKMGVDVTDKEVLDKITSFPAFRRQDGSFVGEDTYQRILRASQTSPEEFEESMRQEIVLEKFQQALTAGIIIPDADVEREYRQRNETASFDLVFVAVGRVLDQVTATDAEAKAYFDANQARFAHPEQRQLRYLLVDESKLRRTLTVPENQIADYYNTHQKEFEAAEQLHARHILITPKTKDDAGWSAALKRAQELHAKAVAPKADFAALAKEFSDDTGSKASGGDLGWFPRGRMVKEFEDAAFALTPGAVSAPVKSQFGYHLIQLLERRPASLRPLTEVHDQIKDKLVEGLADAEGNRRATTLREKIDAAKLTTDDQWHQLATDVVTSNITPYFGQGESIPGLGRDPELIAEVGGAKEGFIGGPRRSSRGWIVYRVSKVRPAGTTPFDEAKEEARDAVRRAKALDRLAGEVEAKRAALSSGSLKDQATAMGGTLQEVKDHRRGAAIPGVGVAKGVEDAVFATPVNALTPVVKVNDRGVAIARVTAKKLVEPQAYAKEKAALRDSMVKAELQRLIGSLLDDAKRNNPVTINPEVVDRFKPKRG